MRISDWSSDVCSSDLGEAGGGGFTEHVDSFRYTGNQDSPLKHLPEFDFELVQTGSHIVPVRRDSVPGSHPHWEYVLSPGRVWDEAGDKDRKSTRLNSSH